MVGFGRDGVGGGGREWERGGRTWKKVGKSGEFFSALTDGPVDERLSEPVI